MAPSNSLDLLAIDNFNNEILHRVYERFSCFTRLMSTKLRVLPESTKIVEFLLFMLPLSFTFLNSILLVIAPSEIVVILYLMF